MTHASRKADQLAIISYSGRRESIVSLNAG
jgi:hypothetical protein